MSYTKDAIEMIQEMATEMQQDENLILSLQYLRAELTQQLGLLRAMLANVTTLDPGTVDRLLVIKINN